MLGACGRSCLGPSFLQTPFIRPLLIALRLSSDYTRPPSFPSDSSLYSLLQVPHDASSYEIKQSYRRILFRLHPDHRMDMTESERIHNHEQLAAVQNAYQTLSDPRKRRLYDRSLLRGTPSSPLPPTSPSVSRFEVPHVSDETWSESFRYGLHTVAQRRREIEEGGEGADRLHEMARGVRALVDAGTSEDWRAAWHRALFGPDISHVPLSELPAAFELEVRNHPTASPHLAELVSGQTLLGQVSLRQSVLLSSPRPPLSISGSTSTFSPSPSTAVEARAPESSTQLPPPHPGRATVPSPFRRLLSTLLTSSRSPLSAFSHLVPSLSLRTETLELTMADGSVAAFATRRPLEPSLLPLVGLSPHESPPQSSTFDDDAAPDPLPSVIEIYAMSPNDPSSSARSAAAPPLEVIARFFNGRLFDPSGRLTHRRIELDIVLSSSFTWFANATSEEGGPARPLRLHRPVPVARGTHTVLPPHSSWLWPPRCPNFSRERYYIETAGPESSNAFDSLKPYVIRGEILALVAAFDALDRERVGKLHRRALRLLTGWTAMARRTARR